MIRPDSLAIDQDRQHPAWIDVAIEVLIGILLVFMPAFFGAVNARAEQVVFILVTLILALFLVRLFLVPQEGLTRSWVYVPVAVFVLLIVLQTIPLPGGLVRIISPNTARIKGELLGQSAPAAVTLTFYSQATLHGLRLVLGAAALFVVVRGYYTRTDRIKRLLTTIAVIGGVFAVFAILQVFTRTDKIYWLIPTGHNLADAGPFVNHSNFAQFMNLSMGAAMALILVILYETFGRKSLSASAFGGFMASSAGKRVGLMAAITILGMASVAVSLSRGGIVAMLVAGGMISLLYTHRRTSSEDGARLIAIVAIMALVCVLYVGFDAVYERMASLQDPDRAESGRWQIVKDIATAWTRFPLFGTGLVRTRSCTRCSTAPRLPPWPATQRTSTPRS